MDPKKGLESFYRALLDVTLDAKTEIFDNPILSFRTLFAKKSQDSIFEFDVMARSYLISLLAMTLQSQSVKSQLNFNVSDLPFQAETE